MMTNEQSGIVVETTDKIFLKDNDTDTYIVKNNFSFNIYKAVPGGDKDVKNCLKKGDVYPKIYIKGLEKLFKNEEDVVNFLQLFHLDNWSVSYGRFRDTSEKCAVFEYTANKIKSDFTAFFQCSEKCTFNQIPDVPDSVVLGVYIDDFGSFFEDVPNRISFNTSIEREFAVYIQEFNAYDANGKVIKAVHTKDKCSISWKIDPKEKATVALYDENESIIANCPPCSVTIDRNRTFHLTAFNEFCSVTKHLNVYATAWIKTCDITGLPQNDTKGHLKIYRQNDNAPYYLYIHPILYSSHDLKTWTEHMRNTSAPSDYKFYSSAFRNNTFIICYLSDNTFTCCTLDLKNNKCEKKECQRSNAEFAYTIFDGNAPRFFVGAKSGILLYNFDRGILLNPENLELPSDVSVMAMDVLSDENNNYAAVLCDNGRVYFFDLKKDKSKHFNCPKAKGNRIFLMKLDSFYIGADPYMFSILDNEKELDAGYFPEFETGTSPALGYNDLYSFAGIFNTKNDKGNKTELWNYQP